MVRDLDRIVERLSACWPEVKVERLPVTHPADDDGLWLFTHPDSSYEVQLESPEGQFPFLVETDAHDRRATASTIEDAVDLIQQWLMYELDINGEPPGLDGQICEALICEQSWYDGQLEETAGVTYIHVSNQWHRLYFDCGIIFWRRTDEAPESYVMKEIGGDVRLDDVGRRLGLMGRRIEFVQASPVLRGSQVHFQFEGGDGVTFRDVEDSTIVLPPAPT